MSRAAAHSSSTMTIQRAADVLRVSRRTIYNYIRDGKLVTKRVGDSQRVFDYSILELIALRGERRKLRRHE
jgi:excisionase family DNA binding protein